MADEARGDGNPMHDSEIPVPKNDSPKNDSQQESDNPQESDGPQESDNPPAAPGSGGQPPSTAWWAPAGRLARFLLGALSLVAGLTWILLNMHGPSAVLDLLIGFVLSAGGLVLLMPHRIDLPRRATAAAMIGIGVAGAAAGLVVARARECCEFAYVVDRGWPITWAQRGGIGDDPDTARRLAGSAHWAVDLIALAGDLLLWAYAGMLLVVVAVLVRRARNRPQP